MLFNSVFSIAIGVCVISIADDYLFHLSNVFVEIVQNVISTLGTSGQGTAKSDGGACG